MSYIFLIIVAMAVTGLFLQWSMKTTLERELISQLKSQCETYADFIYSRISGPDDFIPRSRDVVNEFVSDKSHIIKVYNLEGKLIARPGGKTHPSRFDSGDILDWENLLESLKEHNTPAVQRVWDLLDLESVDVLSNRLPESSLDEAGKQIVITSLNNILEDRNFFDRDAFKDLKSGPEEEALLKKGPENLHQIDIERLNRLLLESTFSGIIARSESPATLSSDKLARILGGETIHWYQTIDGNRFLHVAAPVRLVSVSGGEYVGVTDLAAPLTQIDSTYQGLRIQLFWAIALSVVLTLIISFVLAQTLTRPIYKIEKVSEQIAQGDFSKRVDYKGKDEIRSLSDTINYMAERIETSIREITGEKDKMNALLSAMPEGVIALDHDGNILFMNNAARTLIQLGREEVAGKKLFEAWKEKEVEEFFREGREKPGIYTREISLPPTILKLHLVPFGDREKEISGSMMITRDITDLRRLEETRTKFLGSISHELRTPLTIIKGWIHTIIDEENIVQSEESTRALKIMDEETDRLTRLVNELLELSRLRSKKLSFELETVDIDKIVEETIGQIANNASRMNIRLELESQTSGTELSADKDRFRQVIINLVDNGIKYTPAGGSVTVRTAREDSIWIMEVEDTGMGISKDELPFLFERFFRTKDKNKKKYIKGTGLGMAIVKEIIDAHHGKIQVSSEEGKGTRIHISIPLKWEEESENPE